MRLAIESVDVIVVGGGIAGLSAGARAAELGLKTLLLEKGTLPDYPCNSRYSGGVYHIAHMDPRSPAADLADGICKATNNSATVDLLTALSEQAGAFIRWLQDKGIRFMHAPLPTALPVRRLTGGLDWKGRGPDVVLRRLTDELKMAGGELRLGAQATRLIMRNGRCVGMEILHNGAVVTLQCTAAVILADGGFQSNLDLVAKYISRSPGQLMQRGAATASGDALLMAVEAGAATTDLASFYGHLLSRDAFKNDMLWPYPQIDELAVAGIIVDKTGQRFADEGLGGVYLANAVGRREDPLSTLVVFDATIWEGPGRHHRIPANPLLKSAGATMYSADNVAEVARLVGISAQMLCHTVGAYNAALAAGVSDRLPVPRSTAENTAYPLITPPFFAVPVCAGITYTMGGLCIDRHSRALRDDGGVIGGLYAAGANTGGLEGGTTACYIGGLCRSGVFGKIAAEHIAAERNRS